MSQQTSRAESLFTTAAELASAEERAAFLEGECAGDAELREAVETMLRERDEAAGNFHDARTLIAPLDATMLMPEPRGEDATIVSAPVLGGVALVGHKPVKPSTPVTLPEESYAVGGEIARGGMGSILEAEDRKLGRKVAMKVMRLDASASEDARGRFVREATVLARLEHPNIVPIHELGWDAEGRLFYTMKLVQGRTLQAILNGLKARDPDFTSYYTLDRLLTIFRKICDALSMAHAKGVIHRDLKPENVMVGEFGEVLVMDWGIAKILGDAAQIAEESARKAEATEAGTAGKFRDIADEELRRGSAELTMDGTVMGTPHYMSPEQAEGHVSEIDQQSDVFSLGAILYALLTLHPPVEALSIREVLERIRQGDIRPPTTFNAPTKTDGKGQSLAGAAADPKQFQPLAHCPGGKVPPALSAVTMKALTVDKARRYATVAAFAADIEKYQSGFATSAEEAGLFTQLRLLVQRHKREFAIGFAAWLLITALAVWFVINLRAKERRAIAGEQKAVAEADRATKAEAVAVEKGEAARQSLAKAALALAESARREGNGLEMQAALNDVPEDLRDSTWHYLLDQSDTSIARVRSDSAIIESVAAHPRQAGVFAVADSYNRVSLIEVRTGVRLLKFAFGFPPNTGNHSRRIAISPDGERIAVGRGNDTGGIVIHSARDGKKLLEWTASATGKLEFSSDGKLLLQTEGVGNRLSVWDAASGQLAWAYMPRDLATTTYTQGTFTPNGEQMLTFSADDKFRLVNARDGTLIRAFKGGHNIITALAVGANGTAAAADRNGFVTRFDLRDGHILSEFRAHDKGIPFLAFTPTGEQIVTAMGLPDGRQGLQVWKASTGERGQALLGGSGGISGVSLHPLSGELLVGGPNAKVWNLAGTPAKWTLPTHGFSDSIIFWGLDDLVFGAGYLHRLQADKHPVLWKPASGTNFQPSVSADGRFAAIGWSVSGNGIVVLRNPGPEPERVATFKLAVAPRFVRISPTGDRLAVVGNGKTPIELFDTADGTQLVTLDRKDIFWARDLGWVSGGRQLIGLVTARAGRGTADSEEWVVLWDAATGKILQTTTNRTAMNVLAVAPDGRRFAEAGADKMVRIRDAATLAVQQEFRAHDGPITALAWHPTKPILATGSTDLSIKLWNLDTGRRLEELRGSLTPPLMLSFSPSGHRLGCAALSESPRIWEPQSLNEQPAAKEAADGWEDLLTPLTPAAVAQTGNGWRMDNGVLSSPDKRFTTLPLPGKLSGTSYQVRVKLRQLTAKNGFSLQLPVGDRMVGFDLDGAGGKWTTLTLVNGKWGQDLPGSLEGKQVKDSEQHDLEVTVRLTGTAAVITTTLDGQPLYTWAGQTTALSQNSSWRTAPGTLALGAMAADWVVYEVKVKRL